MALQDFVRLAKWEDRGYYAMKVSTERNQRQLHRLTRRAQEALTHPAAAVLAAASRAMGFADLAGADLAHGHPPKQDNLHGKKRRAGAAQDALSPDQVLLELCVCMGCVNRLQRWWLALLPTDAVAFCRCILFLLRYNCMFRQQLDMTRDCS